MSTAFSLIHDTSQFLAQGGFGCILSPALPIGSVVTQENEYDFVTKIARDAEDEYDIGRYVAARAPDSGVYPVDLICGITPGRLPPKLLAQIRLQCKNTLSAPNKRSFLDGGAAFQEWCAVQYPVYEMDMYKFSIEPYTQYGSSHDSYPRAALFSGGCLTRTANLLMRRLHDLHRNGIFHMDIKLENIAVVSTRTDPVDVRFADWGSLTTILPLAMFKYVNSPPTNRDEMRELSQALEAFYESEFKSTPFPDPRDPTKVRYRGILARTKHYLDVHIAKPLQKMYKHEHQEHLIVALQDPHPYTQALAIVRYLTFLDVASTLTCIYYTFLADRDDSVDEYIIELCKRYLAHTLDVFPRVPSSPLFDDDAIQAFNDRNPDTYYTGELDALTPVSALSSIRSLSPSL
jgi:hypothetical protein